jgi:hypothetical protein
VDREFSDDGPDFSGAVLQVLVCCPCMRGVTLSLEAEGKRDSKGKMAAV